MSLPIAQLGYVPNAHVPNRSHYNVTNPWQDLATQVLAAALGQGVKNVMSRDYNAEADATDPNSTTGTGSLNYISPATGLSTGEGAMAPQPAAKNAPWWEKIVSGPRMDERMYSQIRDERAKAGSQEKSQAFSGAENEKDRYAKSVEGSLSRSHAEQLQRAAEEAMMGRQAESLAVQRQGQTMQADQSRMQADLARQELAARQAGSVPQLMSAGADVMNAQTRQSADGTAARVSEDLMQSWIKYQTEYARQAQTAKLLNQPVPPPMDINAFINQYMQLRGGVSTQLQQQPLP
jgi:hypothetical protein